MENKCCKSCEFCHKNEGSSVSYSCTVVPIPLLNGDNSIANYIIDKYHCKEWKSSKSKTTLVE